MTEWVNGSVVTVNHWTPSLFSLQLEAPVAPFIAGQFAKLALVIEGRRIQRAYSYVNAPENTHLEFYLINVPDGKLSPHLHALKAGDTLMVTKQASGFFVLDEIPTCKTLWMLATGTAIGPYLSILQQGTGLERFENIVLVHAARFFNDLSYLPLMNKLKEQYAGKVLIQSIVSREQVPNVLTGRIPALIQSGQLEEAVQLTMHSDDSHVMLCGNPQMVRDTQTLLKETRGMTKHLRRQAGHITSENYW